MRRRELLWLGALVILVILQAAPAGNRNDEAYRKIGRFMQVLEQVKSSYWTEVDEEKLYLGAYKGMLAELDPYSQYMTREDVEQLMVDTEGEFGGLGIEITLDENRILTVITPIEDTPAIRAGVQPGDRIVEIEGESTYNITLMDAVKKLRGKPGTKVTITVLHVGRAGREQITITRDIIKVKSIRAAHLVDEDGKIGYVRMTNFQKTTPDELDAAIKELRAKGMRGLVLDLRRNPGGLLDSAVKVSDLFIEKGTIVSTRGRTPDSVQKFEAHKDGTYTDFPMAVLISNYSASGSEILAGAIQDTHRGILVGTRTFGKGSVQSILGLGDGAKLRLTTARYFTPSGRMIHRERNAKQEDAWGIQPDIEVKTTYEQELGLIRHWRDQRIDENNGAEKPKEPETVEDTKEEGEEGPFVDEALNRAVDALKAILVYNVR